MTGRTGWMRAPSRSASRATAVVSGEEAPVYDTHTSVEHARFVRDVLEGEGVARFTVVLSHWHLDHVAGTEVFGDSEVISARANGRGAHGED